MLEHSAMYLNVTPPYEDDTSFFPDFYTTRLGPCELQDPVWAKMSALAAGVNKKRKKSEPKPQAQINKCNNEKRRREQENNYIEELAELISANIADMSTSVKPDKCAILQEAVNQIRSIKQETTTQSSDPVQQGEVSSSRPTILSNELYGPLLLEALEGFLFVVNNEGKVEHVTENVSTYIKFTKEEILGKSIYNFIHHGDHTKFHSNLLPMTIEWGNEQQVTNRSKSIDIRLLVKPPDDIDETVEEKQQRNFCYELMHISSTQLRDQISVSEEDGSDSGPCLLCVASRISHRDKSVCSIEQFTTKLDTTGKVICVDTFSVSDVTAQYIRKEFKSNRVLKELVPQQDVHKVNAHLREAVSTGLSTSAIYKLQLGQDRFIRVQTKSKLFKTQATNDSDFIMATHSIINTENDSVGPTDPGGGSILGATATNNNPTSNSSSMGGPLMTSIVNGTARNGPQLQPNNENATNTSSTPNSLLNQNSTFSTFNLDNEYLDLFPSSTWELEPNNWQEATRPDSRHSVTTPTSRPPSNPSYSNAPTVVQSPPFQTQPSPSVSNNTTPTTYGGASFPFSMLEDQNYPIEEQKDTKANVLEEAMMESNKLRNLLTEPQSDSRDRILKELLNRKDDDTGKNDNRQSPRGLMNRPSMPGPSEPPKTANSSNGGNNMLLQLLNEKSSDDDELESRAGVKNKSELLQQLLKDTEKDTDDDRKSESQSHRDDTLLRSLGFPPSPNDRSRKRPSEDRDEGPNCKRDTPQVSSSLRERNKMLASLLAKQPVNNQPIPPVPAHEITATPQDKLPRIIAADPLKVLRIRDSNTMSSNSMNNAINDMIAKTRISVNRMSGQPAQTTNYLNTVMTASSLQQHNDGRHQLNQVNSNCYPATSSTNPNTNMENNNLGVWANNNLATNQIQSSNDPLLSDILDEVMSIIPDDITQLLESPGVDLQNQSNNYQTMLPETMAIEFIQKSLMQYESVVKSTASSNAGTPPAYSTANLSNQIGIFSHPGQAAAKLQQRTQQIRLGAVSQQYGGGTLTVQQQQQLLQQKKLQQQQQQEQKRRLLMQQKQQHLLIPSNAAVNEMNPMIQNIDSILNNTVAPNVTLKRSSSIPEQQLSPGYSGQLTTQAQRVGSGQQQPFSPHSQMPSPLGQQNFAQTTTVGSFPNPGQQRLSPQSQFNAQLSPRQAYPQVTSQNANWQQQAQVRLTMQQNPMLTAQLTGNNFGPNGRNFQRPSAQTTGQSQQQRTLSSPGSVVPTRHSPFQADQFPPPTSPNSAFNNQYLRLQRTNSAPNATTQLPGGLGSPRPYGREHHHPHPPPSPYHASLPPPTPHPQQQQQPPPNLPPPPQAQSQPMMYQQHQQDSQYCPAYDPMGYPGVDRGRQVPPQHLQPGVSASGPTSEFVRQELRAVVGARTAQAQPATPQTAQSNARGQQSQMIAAQQQQQQQTVTDLESLGLTFEMPSGASDSPKLWGAMGSDMGSMSPQPPSSRTTMEETRPCDQKSSLLQKLLSE